MSFIPVKQVGQFGVNRDLSSSELPANAWTDCQNIRFLDGSAYQYYGHGEIFAGTVVEPYHVLPVTVAGVRYWLYAGAGKIYQVGAPGGVITHTNITRASGGDYAATRNSWTSTVLGGIPILNNGVDAPQQWLLTGACTALSNWPANTTCAVMRSFKNLLVALDITKSGTRYPYMVKVSHPADPGAVSVTWDITDATKDALEYDISSGYGYIIDGLELRNSFMIYKTDGVFRMDYTGGAFVVSNQKVLGMSGALNKNCITEIDGQHFALTGFDVVVHDGNQATSVLDKQTRRFLFNNIDSDNIGKCFVFKNPYLNEIFVCYPTPGNTQCNQAMVWNYVDKTISFRDIPNLNHAAYGALDSGSVSSFDGDADAIASDISAFNANSFTPDLVRVVMASGDTKLYQLDSSSTFNGTIPSAFLERKGLHFDAPEAIKLCKGVRPKISGTIGATVNVQIGWSNEPYETPTYGDAVPFVIGTTVAVDSLSSGRYMAIKFSSGTAYTWRLDSYQLEIQPQGAW